MSSTETAAGREPGRNLLSLAPEVVEQVIKQVSDRRDLSNVRLACKELDKHAANELFKDVLLSPSEEHVNTWNEIIRDDRIRHLPRHAIIHTQPDIEDKDYGEEREDVEDREEFETALLELTNLPNLDSVEIGFTPECMGDRDTSWYEDVVEDPSRREEMLQLIFEAIQKRAENKENRTIRKLTIINLQNCPIHSFTASDLFRQVMCKVEELHLVITQEYNEHGPDHDYTRKELQTFPAYLCEAWLEPVSNDLKALSIFHRTDNWGPFPGYFDPSGLSFPKLETLALGYYTLAHDNDLDWILAIKSLKNLTLYNCMIASWVCIDSENMEEWQPPTHDWTRLPEEDEEMHSDQFAYGGRWSQNFDRIAGNLPNLVDFRFDQASSYNYNGWPQYGLKHRHTCGARIFPRRYICFDNGILPTHWPEANEEGVLHSWLDDGFPTNVHKESLEEDQKSLDKLLDVCRLTRSKG
ncbi:hypothetical protein Daus18300_003863 [Diaporthe australafricana]|uniref:F-box domain-containing protein n=1 Tax=Diaporthe australafricana TaxID=127596 RepID=A0ABR3XCI1_9PEZI